ncbi:hypothetical protein PG994_010916 [Apiospora phragmitis]|uniref:T6SS Phospholipase effector Tle1-like catalytic domain-containing protein n=1 Tax=Apiospora phragmitis TaxID=2905665 RepID=A0ABR1TRB1_9PEZI
MGKRIIVCCDGTWQNSVDNYVKASPQNPTPRLAASSNATRISRSFARTCKDGTFQVIYYQVGVGSGSSSGSGITNILSRILGGAFGVGIAENIREAYSYICANHVDGDEIVLLGFSRGAFTARSIAGMITNLGLLTRTGMDYFFPIFKDSQNFMNYNYEDPFPKLPFPNKPKGDGAVEAYRTRLVELGYTRVHEKGGDGDPIKIKAVGVWDTVGSLGIPTVPFLEKLSIFRSTVEYQWYNTNLSDKIEHAFQALALDEIRGPFSPAIWERHAGSEVTIDLRQVWFPGGHSNIGGGEEDQGVSNMTLAWMMDQLASIGVEFVPDALVRVFKKNVKYYQQSLYVDNWAISPIVEANKPVRPWALHKTVRASGGFYKLLLTTPRTPGRYKKINPDTGKTTSTFLEETNERIHSSVRVRLVCEGRSPGDEGEWKCPPLLRHWRPRKVLANFYDPTAAEGEASSGDSTRWVWEYNGREEEAPAVRTMVEENLGPYEKYLLKISGGKPSVVEYAEQFDLKKCDYYKSSLVPWEKLPLKNLPWEKLPWEKLSGRREKLPWKK